MPPHTRSLQRQPTPRIRNRPRLRSRPGCTIPLQLSTSSCQRRAAQPHGQTATLLDSTSSRSCVCPRRDSVHLQRIEVAIQRPLQLEASSLIAGSSAPTTLMCPLAPPRKIWPERTLPTNLPRIRGPGSLGYAGSHPATCSTCAPSPRPGQAISCNALVHNCHGGPISCGLRCSAGQEMEEPAPAGEAECGFSGVTGRIGFSRGYRRARRPPGRVSPSGRTDLRRAMPR